MSFEYAPPRDDDELHAFAAVAMQALHPTFPGEPDWFEKFKRRLGPHEGNARVVRSNGVVAGGLVDLIMGQWFGGKIVPVSGISAVAIAPEFRGRGAASTLMRASILEQFRERTRPIASLYPATQPLYRKVGYERAGALTTWHLDGRAIRGRSRELDVRAVGPNDRALLVRLYAHRAARNAGHLERNGWMWSRVLEPPRDRAWAYVFERDGAAEGYVVYVKKQNPVMRYELWLNDVVATTPRAHRAILAFLAEHATMAESVSFHGAPTDPFVAGLEEQAELACKHRIDWMLRLVDVPRALEARGYPKPIRAALHLRLDDDLIPENRGDFVLTVEDGEPRVTVGGRGDLRLHVRALASLYSGYLSAHTLAGMGALEADEATLSLADTIFAGPTPWMPDMF